MAGKKKQWITVLVLAGCLFLLGGVYLLIPDSDREEPEPEEEKLYSLEKEEITRLRYSNEYADVSMERKGDSWVLSEDGAFPVDQEKVELMVEAAASMSISRTVTEKCEDVSEYQLDEPSLQIEITMEDGTSKNITYGMKSDVAEGYYVTVDDSKEVYIAANDSTMDFEYSVNQLMEVPELAEIATEYVTGYQVDKREGTDFAAVYAEKNPVSPESSWNIEKAYSQTVAGDEDGLQEVFDNACLLELTEGVCYSATKKERKQYGLEEPLAELKIEYFTVKEEAGQDGDTQESDDAQEGREDIPEKDREYHSFTLCVGEQNDMEEGYYVSVGGQEGIYLMPSETVDSLIGFDTFACVYKTPCPTYPEGLQGLTVEYQGKCYDYQQTKSGQGEDGQYTVKGSIRGKAADKEAKKIDTEKFHTVYSELGALSYSAAIKKSVKPSSDTPVASVTVKEEGRSYKAEFLPYDETCYRVKVDGMCQFVVQKEAADRVIKGFVQE